MIASTPLLAWLKETFTQEEFVAKSLLVKEGALAKKLFYIEAGCCRCWFTTDAGKEVTMNFGFEGSFVSSMETIIAAEPSWYNVETLEPTVAYSLPLTTFHSSKRLAATFEKLTRGMWSSGCCTTSSSLLRASKTIRKTLPGPAGPPARPAATGAAAPMSRPS